MYEDDIFVEEMVVRRKTVWNLLLTAAMILGGLAVIILVWLVVPFISTVLILIIGFAVYLGVRFQYVEYEYSFRETNVYKNLARDPYPEWDWFSSITPVNGYGPGKKAFVAFPFYENGIGKGSCLWAF